MGSEQFRRQLRQEADLWRAEGLIEETQYQQLVERYQLHSLDVAARNRFIVILLGLGSVLIGLGVIIFVAANWQELPRFWKVTLLLSLFTGVNIVGFYESQHAQSGRQRLGQGLLLLGALILGANMALMGQTFHQGGAFYELLLAWGLGVLVMAYGLSSTSLGILSFVIVVFGYWGGWWDLAWGSWSALTAREWSWALLVVQHMPILAGFMFVPLAYGCRSGWIFSLGASASVISLVANLRPFSLNLFSSEAHGWVMAIALALPPALLWGYDDSFWLYGNLPWLSHLYRSHPRLPPPRSFQPLARSLALIFLGIAFYLPSSGWFWELLTPNSTSQIAIRGFPWIDVVVLSGITLVAWVRLLRSNPRTNRSELLATRVVGAMIAIAAITIFWHVRIQAIPMMATAIFNLLLFLLAIGLMREGLGQGRRRAFWGGMVLAILRIFSWFFLFSTDLLFKSLIFILGGAGIILIGLWFERHVQTLTPTSKLHQQTQSSPPQEDAS
ncbi:MAG: DUF2157 domain-containing protein [Leptolyngbyaceae bacterium]|nr:DUF2157 domain-containing protein [Leptolyngbyaceae bacterium]